MEDKQLTIILGAGASSDIIGSKNRNLLLDGAYKPPLTKELFNIHKDLEPILERYGDAHTAIISMRAAQREDKSLEQLLRELKESEEKEEKLQFKQIPLCLQDLFTQVSFSYCKYPANYVYLIGRVLRKKFSQITFLTTNYDYLLESALVSSSKFTNIDDYISNRQWKLIKLHGSINWGRDINKDLLSGRSLNRVELLNMVRRLDLNKDLKDTIVLDASYNERERHTVRYPAITVPLDNKYEINCPPEHIKALEANLSTCPNYLIIGSSGKDDDLLDILQKNVRTVHNLLVIGHGEAYKIRKRFQDKIHGFLNASNVKDVNGGFSHSIETGELESFISSI